jgi:hypothetical protein
MTDSALAADIEVVVNKDMPSDIYRCDVEYVITKARPTLLAGEPIGVRLIFNPQGIIRRFMYEDYRRDFVREKMKFHSNGVLAEIVRDIGGIKMAQWSNRTCYEHAWTKRGETSVTCWIKDGRLVHQCNEYDKNGLLKLKTVYKADGEKDYVVVYWNGPPLPTTEDGAIHRSTIPIVPPLESELRTEKKERLFDLSTLENAVLREEDITTL